MDIAVLEEISAILEGISEGASGIQMILSPLTSIGSLITYVLMGLAVMMLGQKLGVKKSVALLDPLCKRIRIRKIGRPLSAGRPRKKG